MFSFGYFPGWMKNIFFIQPLKMDLTEGSETSAKLNLTPGKYPKENIQIIIIIIIIINAYCCSKANNSCANGLQCYFIRTLSVLFI
jgi:hypothetical protein